MQYRNERRILQSFSLRISRVAQVEAATALGLVNLRRRARNYCARSELRWKPAKQSCNVQPVARRLWTQDHRDPCLPRAAGETVSKLHGDAENWVAGPCRLARQVKQFL